MWQRQHRYVWNQFPNGVGHDRRCSHSAQKVSLYILSRNQAGALWNQGFSRFLWLISG